MSEADTAWSGLVLYVVLYDIFAGLTGRETLSSSFYRALGHPTHRYPLITVYSYLTLHLFHLIPDRFDPLRAHSIDLTRSAKP